MGRALMIGWSEGVAGRADGEEFEIGVADCEGGFIESVIESVEVV